MKTSRIFGHLEDFTFLKSIYPNVMRLQKMNKKMELNGI
jgi:hypothetical protein